MEGFNKALAKFPIVPLIIAYLGWIGYSYNDWLNSPESELGLKKQSIEVVKGDLEAAKKKLETGEEFFKNLDAIRVRIRQLTGQLDDTKAILSTDIDIANFVRMITLEAKKLGISIKSITPMSEVKKEYYTEVPFNVSLQGAYLQVLVFYDRIARLQQVIRVSDFGLTPTGNTYTKYVELAGNVRINGYKYLGTQADEVIHKAEMKNSDRSDGK